MSKFDVIWLLFFVYFTGLHSGYIFLNVVSFMSISRYMRRRFNMPAVYTDFMPPVSLLIPAHNEEGVIVSSVRSLLQLSYPEYEIVVINDGSSDRTLDVMVKEFSMVPFPETYRMRIKTAKVGTIYHSTSYPNLRVLDKERGGKADALNAGINSSRYPLYCAMDADSILMRDSLLKIVEPFLEDPRTVASGGTVRVANGCVVRGGFLEKVGLPRNFLALFQIIEYLRAFLFGRIGWVPINALLIISGAFGLFRKETVISVGGYRTDTVGEDMELVVRLHRKLGAEGRPYRISFLPDPICWTEVPEDIRTLGRQRVRWQRGLSESLGGNIGLLFSGKGGAAGWIAFPFFMIFEWLGPIFEVSGYVYTAIGVFTGFVPTGPLIAFLVVSIGFGVLLSITSVMLEEMAFHLYPRIKHLLVLFMAAIVENLGYRQLNSLWRLQGLLKWAFFKKGGWGHMKRKGIWQRQ